MHKIACLFKKKTTTYNQQNNEYNLSYHNIFFVREKKPTFNQLPKIHKCNFNR